jgi:hypothetical protein
MNNIDKPGDSGHPDRLAARNRLAVDDSHLPRSDRSSRTSRSSVPKVSCSDAWGNEARRQREERGALKAVMATGIDQLLPRQNLLQKHCDCDCQLSLPVGDSGSKKEVIAQQSLHPSEVNIRSDAMDRAGFDPWPD